MKRLALLLPLTFSLACASSSDTASAPSASAGDRGGDSFTSTGPAKSTSGGSAAPGVPSSASSPPAVGGTQGIGAGVLTAGAWDDNRNFDFFSAYLTAHQTMPGLLGLTNDERSAARTAFEQRSAKTTLDVSLVIDATGSMADEIQYLATELTALTQSIKGRYPNADQRWSLVTYRDVGDDYVTDAFDFTSDGDAYRAKLSAARANGGGDFPEAPDQGLSKAVGLSWRGDQNTAKLAFWVADAPHHDNKADAMTAAIRSARDKGVHVYPVASSGVDELTELTMRSAAQLTGGRYLFLTDDSGVGGEHKEPSIPCYFVTKLDKAILRMVDVELTGTYREPTAEEVIRVGGNPTEGKCTLQSGTTVNVF